MLPLSWNGAPYHELSRKTTVAGAAAIPLLSQECPCTTVCQCFLKEERIFVVRRVFDLFVCWHKTRWKCPRLALAAALILEYFLYCLTSPIDAIRFQSSNQKLEGLTVTGVCCCVVVACAQYSFVLDRFVLIFCRAFLLFHNWPNSMNMQIRYLIISAFIWLITDWGSRLNKYFEIFSCVLLGTFQLISTDR